MTQTLALALALALALNFRGANYQDAGHTTYKLFDNGEKNLVFKENIQS